MVMMPMKMMNPTTTTTRKSVMMPGIILMMTVVGSFTAVAVPLSNPYRRFVTTLPPPTTTPPFQTTIPRGCRTYDGRTLFPGQELTITEQGACRVCSCSWNSQLSCYYADCGPTLCVSPVQPEGACCPHCPNGEHNCRILRTGEVIPAGIRVERDGQQCACPPPPQYFSQPYVHEERFTTAVCLGMTTIPPTTTPPPTTTTTPSPGIPVGRRC